MYLYFINNIEKIMPFLTKNINKNAFSNVLTFHSVKPIIFKIARKLWITKIFLKNLIQRLKI